MIRSCLQIFRIFSLAISCRDPICMSRARLRAATLVVVDEFIMIGRQMMGKICFKARHVWALIGKVQASVSLSVART